MAKVSPRLASRWRSPATSVYRFFPARQLPKPSRLCSHPIGLPIPHFLVHKRAPEPPSLALLSDSREIRCFSDTQGAAGGALGWLGQAVLAGQGWAGPSRPGRAGPCWPGRAGTVWSSIWDPFWEAKLEVDLGAIFGGPNHLFSLSLSFRNRVHLQAWYGL